MAGDHRTADRKTFSINDFSIKRPLRPRTWKPSKKRMAELERTSPVGARFETDAGRTFFESIGEKVTGRSFPSIPADQTSRCIVKASSSTCAAAARPVNGQAQGIQLMKLAGAYWRGDSKNEMLPAHLWQRRARKEDQGRVT